MLFRSDLTTTNTYAEINLEISSISQMHSLIWNWQGTNHTLFDNSLVLMYNFDNVSLLGENNNLVYDISGNGNNGTISGATFTSSGKYNKALVFDGDDYIDAGTGNSLDITGDITISAWVKADAGGPTLGGVSNFVKIDNDSMNGQITNEIGRAHL